MRYEAGFTLKEDVLCSQKVFRSLLLAMSYPGRIVKIQECFSFPYQVEVPMPLASIAYTLLDGEVSFAAIGKDKERIEEDIRRLTGARVEKIQNADYVFVLGENSRGKINLLKRGTPEYPDSSATVVYYVDAISKNGPGIAIQLEGPGIKCKRKVFLNGLDVQEFLSIKSINLNYPLGLDCIFADRSGNTFCLPRSVRLEVI